MSEIRGKGYGDKHDWKDLGTEQSSIPSHRSTLYHCQKCNIFFRHYYHVIPCVFEAMKVNEIKEECEMTNDCELCKQPTHQAGLITPDVILLCESCYQQLLENSGMDK